ncbi:MAG: PLDc_N domain-containing protein [Propionibacterium sp.]|jgi:hypothetical protein|uniref:Cardiolipin synthase N-terminal domain-containing protein n=1 Tax=Brooklawnia propionicigenes TaxID=3041175 RepID=A0AAN0MHK7_9ACTN|nr:PLD nuclease N-terminal domain-containing protein [Brooklawnia sp. SH051]MEA5119668.1 PLD nuclease N-terminal domain-containing protein [Propionibacterium sp.]NLI86226.1 PLDc_N domain-containing protein [Propionibacterium sp.]BEH02832.1 hypothetical protein brsh051_21130 [Brooklawnia sp. SH051]
MARIIPILVLIALTIYCTIEVAQARTWEVRRAPKWLWAVAVICVPGIGPLAWLFFGRPLPPGRGNPPPRSLPPDENEDFLRGL